MNKSAAVQMALCLDLVDNDAAIEAYERAHKAVWPEVIAHLRTHGVLQMEIYRLGTRLFMVMQVDPSVYSAQSMALAERSNPIVAKWEAEMGKYQIPTPWTTSGQKWMPMMKIFALS
jgi:L-rhamnose mutarotase